MSDSPAPIDRIQLEKKAKYWYDLIAQFPNDHLDEFETFDQFLAWQKIHKDIPLSMWTYKEMADEAKSLPEEETTTRNAEREEKHGSKKQHASDEKKHLDPFWTKAVDAAGNRVSNVEDDRRLGKIKEHLAKKWHNDHPNNSDKDNMSYLSVLIADPQAPLDKIFNINKEEAQIETDAREWLRHIHPEAVAIYEENEKTEVKSDAGKDRLFRREILKVKKTVGDQFEAWEKAGESKTDAEKYQFLVGAQLKGMAEFVKLHPGKAEVYARNNGYIAKALELHKQNKEITEEDIKALVDPEGLRYFSSLFHPERATAKLPLVENNNEVSTEITIPIIPTDATINPDDYKITRKIISMPASIDNNEDNSDEDFNDEMGGYNNFGEDYDEQDQPYEEPRDEQNDYHDQALQHRRQKRNPFDRARGIRERIRGAQKLAKGIKNLQNVQKLAQVVRAAPIFANPYVLAGIGILILLIFIIVLIMLLFVGDRDNAPIPISINKTGPAAVGNGEQIDYTLTVSFPGTISRATVTDEIPEDTEFVSASNGGTYDAATRTVTWEIQGNGTQRVGTTTYDTQAYIAPPFLLPIPTCTDCSATIKFTPEEITNLKNLGARVEKYQTYLRSIAPGKNNPMYVDPFVSVIWSGAIEGIKGNTYFYNCLDKSKDINAGCVGGYKSGGWQVGYGVQVHDVAGWLADAFDVVYGAGSSGQQSKVLQVGNDVMTHSTAGAITNPATFPNDTVQSLVTKANGGDSAAQQAIAILMMDPDIGAILVSRAVAGNISNKNNWRATMEGWNAYYRNNMQRFSNNMQAIAEQYNSAAGSQTLTLSLKPLKNDMYVINQASAQGFGFDDGSSGPNTTPSGSLSKEDSPPNDENCNGFYLNIISTNPLRQNFGDPFCEALNKENTTIDKEKIVAEIKKLDEPNSAKWVAIMVCMTTNSNPNAFSKDNTENGWGLFAMDGINGGVHWVKQIKNAIEVNKQNGGDWSYWGCNVQ